MHTGEEWFSLGWQHYLVLAVLLLVYLFLVFANKLPKMSSFKDFVDVINTSGGHIVLLALFTWWSIKIAMQFFYHTMGLPGDSVPKHDALVSQGIQFVTGTLVGSFLGALLKTMSGGKANGVVPLTETPAPAIQAMLDLTAKREAEATAAPAGAPAKPIGFVGNRGVHGDLGTNNRSRA